MQVEKYSSSSIPVLVEVGVDGLGARGVQAAVLIPGPSHSVHRLPAARGRLL